MKCIDPDKFFKERCARSCIVLEGPEDISIGLFDKILELAQKEGAQVTQGVVYSVIQFPGEEQALWSETELRARLRAGPDALTYLEPATGKFRGAGLQNCLVLTASAKGAGSDAFAQVLSGITSAGVRYGSEEFLVRVLPEEKQETPPMVRQELIELNQLADFFGE